MDQIPVGLPRVPGTWPESLWSSVEKLLHSLIIRSTHGTGAEMDLSSKIDFPP